MEGTATPWWPGLTASWLEPEVRVSSRGLTLDMIGWMEVSGARVGRLVVLVNIILTSNTHLELRTITLKDFSFTDFHLISQTEENAMKTLPHLTDFGCKSLYKFLFNSVYSFVFSL